MDIDDLTKKAIEYAKLANSQEDPTRYLDHANRIIELLQSIGIQSQTVFIAVYLHNILSKNLLTTTELTQEFGLEIAEIVVNLNTVSQFNMPIDSNDTTQLYKLFISLAKDYRVLLIRVADRADNIATCHKLEHTKQIQIAHKALNIYAPIAQAAGIYAFTKILQDNALKILEPKEYELIDQVSNQKFKDIESQLNHLKAYIGEFLSTQNIAHQITYRIKSHYSIFNKTKRKYGQINMQNLSKLNDLAGIRILVNTVDDCYWLLAELQKKYELIQNEYDDYIANPKPNGYQTLQTSFYLAPEVTCEIQIRTFEMHERNEFGNASHFNYKYKNSNNIDGKWIKNLIELKQKALLAVDNKLPLNLFDDLVFIFTPKNDLITLPKGSTVIDFAYAIHTDLGDHLASAKINNKIQKITTPLKSGDVIEISTSKTIKPKSDWLLYTKTREAKKQIKAASRIN